MNEDDQQKFWKLLDEYGYDTVIQSLVEWMVSKRVEDDLRVMLISGEMDEAVRLLGNQLVHLVREGVK